MEHAFFLMLQFTTINSLKGLHLCDVFVLFRLNLNNIFRFFDCYRTFKQQMCVIRYFMVLFAEIVMHK